MTTAFKIQETEAQFQERVEQYATIRGWKWMHVQKTANDRGYWRTPIRGMLGKGFPDLFMVRGHRIIAAELKGSRGRYSASQEQVLGWLTETGYVEVYRWQPKDWDSVIEVLQ